jgi:hypothetical protein
MPTRFSITVSFAAIVAGCYSAAEPAGDSRPGGPQEAPPVVASPAVAPAVGRPTTLSEAAIVDVARRTVQEREPWFDRPEFSKPVCKKDGSWYVFAWRRPRTENGFRFLRLDKLGNVTEYVPGAAYRGRAEEPFGEELPHIKTP